ncbi:phosphoribosylaminoimidazolecarboxamide formyltransferase [Planctomycetales bacterium]|nr:phosphoribosylaminoimidazolecarboxamide formyltransferase [Planctomycetales bacterium]
MPDLKKMYRTVLDDHFPPEMKISFGDRTLVYKKRTWKISDGGDTVEKGLRYGENPGQEAALYELVGGELTLGDCEFIRPGNGLVSALDEENLLQFGKHPGKINLTDLDSAANILRYLSRPACAIMKHNNPSGVAYGDNAADAYTRANAADRLAAFGGAAVFNAPVDKTAASALALNYLELVAAPEYETGALEILAARKNLRIVKLPKLAAVRDYAPLRFVDFKSLIDGGIIVQQSPLNRIKTAADFLPASVTDKNGVTVKIERTPTDAERDEMLFGWAVEQGVTSNSVIFVKDGCTVGIGAGEQDRVGVAEIAIFKAYKKYADEIAFRRYGCLFFEAEIRVKEGSLSQAALDEILAEAKKARGGLIGSVAVSDAFFPKRDGVDACLREGVTAIVQPGGSLADQEVIAVCNAADATMVFTGQRAFKH